MSAPNILVVDDQPINVQLLKRKLEREGIQVTAAYNGMEALQSVAANKPDLILLDVMMPGMDGFQATRKLQTDVDTQDIPVIIISGNTQATIQSWVQKIGARDFMAKPFERGEFFQRLESAIY